MQGVGFRVLGFGCRIHGTQAFTTHEPEQSLAVLVGGVSGLGRRVQGAGCRV